MKFLPWLLLASIGIGVVVWVSWPRPTALQLLERSATRGDVGAQDRLAGIYNDGRGVPKDYAKAAYWYEKAAHQGNADAQDMLVASFN
jgi:TPR repeat protein